MIARRSVAAARAVAAVAFLDLFMQFPTVAPYAADLGAAPGLVGVIVGAYSASNLVGNVIAGTVLDRWGRRRPLLASLALTAAVIAAYTLARDARELLALRVLHGLAASVLTVAAFAIMGDVTPAESRAQVMGQGGALIGATAVIGPPLAGFLRDRAGFDAVFITAAAVMLLTLVVAWRLGRETVRPTAYLAGGAAMRVPRPLGAAYAAVFAYTVGLGAAVTHLALLLQAAGLSGGAIGMAFGLFALVAVAVMLSPLTRASDRYGRRRPLVTGLMLVALGLLVMGLSGISAVAGMGIFGTGFGLVFPSAAALVAESVPPGERGRAFGVFYALWSLGTVAGAGLAGVIAQVQGVITGLSFAAASAAAVAGVAVVLRLLPPARRTAPVSGSAR
ncbi:MAG TPA: MFS transporter [bacterium]|nr:MFS transporter [bacterium]